MSTGPPLPAHLWDGLPPEALALILALRAEVAALRARAPGPQHQAQGPQDRMSRNTTGSSGPPSPNPPLAKRQPPQSPRGGVATVDTDTSPCGRLRELLHQSPRKFGKPR